MEGLERMAVIVHRNSCGCSCVMATHDKTTLLTREEHIRETFPNPEYILEHATSALHHTLYKYVLNHAGTDLLLGADPGTRAEHTRCVRVGLDPKVPECITIVRHAHCLLLRESM